MSLRAITAIIEDTKEMRQLLAGLRNGAYPYQISGLSGADKAAYIAALFNKTLPRPLLLLTLGNRRAQDLALDLEVFVDNGRVCLFPDVEVLPHEEVAAPLEIMVSRLEVLEGLARGERLLVVAPIDALMRALPPVEAFRERFLTIEAGARSDLEELLAALIDLGYERVSMVEGPGQFARRGGILDIYPPTRTEPVRCEFFGDEILSLRAFDPVTQRSMAGLEEVQVGPAREFTAGTAEQIGDEILAIAAGQADRIAALKGEKAAQELLERVRGHVEKLREGVKFYGKDQYLPHFYPKLATLLDYLPEGLLVIDEPERIREHLQVWERELGEQIASLLEKGAVLPSYNANFVSPDELAQRAKAHPQVAFTTLPRKTKGGAITVQTRAPGAFHGKMKYLLREVEKWRAQNYRVVFVMPTADRAKKLAQSLTSEGLPVAYNPLIGQLSPGVAVSTRALLSCGFELPSLKLVVLTEEEMFGRRRKAVRTRTQHQVEDGAKRVRLTHYADLQRGDYVVHVNHGIGRYLGMETLEIGGVHKDYLVVQYAGEDKLYVPVDQVDLLQKYIGADDKPPRLYKLGSSEWSRVKKRVKESVQELAKDLLELYAAREAIEGHAFAPDTPWQEEFEAAFMYEETPDQVRAVEEVKRDMESPRPMDRLLCGDVGYGKTEVAIRAAFKAVMDGKQVAVLVPTTILAQQHERTFKERFEGYPIRIETLSRFESRAEQREISKGLADGTVDIVIGTHRLLSSDIVFKSLGLMIIDEEQRFGVVQKEKLKAMRKNIDVLTLTATPIPRTLHMSLVGVRDMSIIETPPEGRYPIRTYVVEYNDEIIREAILRELDRGGQVYFVYNQIRGIDKMKSHLLELVPHARIVTAHGQMDERHLEQVMLDFLAGEYDILLCTTIIETGMDIGNVNTLIVCDADRMGLAQMYQLRGRVGRSNRVAYAYFTYRGDKILTEDAEKRLQAIREFTELGSGFKLAMRDLEIRGAGNILGSEQHGFIASVGFELYCRLLEESVKQLKGEVVQELPQPVMDLNVDAYVPDEYVDDSRQKVEIYKKVIAVKDLAGVDALAREVADRFGPIPEPVENLLQAARLKILARDVGITSLTREKDSVLLKFVPGLVLPWDLMTFLARKYRGRLLFQKGRIPQLRVNAREQSDPALLGLLSDVLSDLNAAWEQASGQ